MRDSGSRQHLAKAPYEGPGWGRLSLKGLALAPVNYGLAWFVWTSGYVFDSDNFVTIVITGVFCFFFAAGTLSVLVMLTALLGYLRTRRNCKRRGEEPPGFLSEVE